MPTYFDGQNLTDDAILTEELMRSCTFGITNTRPVPDTLNMKDKDRFDYFTRNLQVTYPDSKSSTAMIIPNVVFHCDTFDHFKKTGVYIGVPQHWVDFIRTKLTSKGIITSFEDPGLSSDDKYWWTRQGFVPAEEGSEYIFVVDEDEEGNVVEDPFVSFPDMFRFVGASAIANATCSIKMTSKLPKNSKGGWSGAEEWRMGITVSRINVTDFIDIEKPRTTVSSRSVAGTKDKAKKRLLDRIRQNQEKYGA